LVVPLLAGCHSNSGSVYGRPIPDRSDTTAQLDIRDGLKPEDQEAWQGFLMRKINPMAEPVTSKTVGEAIRRMKVKLACMKAHDSSKVPENNFAIGDARYDQAQAKWSAENNKEVSAYNDCLKLTV
jgi:hypothetical protein